MAWETRPVRAVDDGQAPDAVAVEEPLEIRVHGRSVAVTMRTPGHDRELAAGFLLTEGIVDGPDDLAALEPVGTSGNVVDCVLSSGVDAHRDALERATRELYASSACGICGKTSIDRVRIVASCAVPAHDLAPAFVLALPARLREGQAGFLATGGLHGAALARLDGSLEVVREDVGRHNAVDKVLGWRLLADRVPVSDAVLVVSSRAGFEIVQKARIAGVGAIVALGAATTLAVDLARDAGIALYGFASADRFNRYA
ncbi:MAG: formate dehydrogenase accessory sulfurtransferase FdhD [Alphaproteobacteria bacterium]|nr:formate dehydrogenase accessory sulfurtransferase FdhD [Alphaproteobacteria bacterium]